MAMYQLNLGVTGLRMPALGFDDRRRMKLRLVKGLLTSQNKRDLPDFNTSIQT
jgi:hypothetical protein